MGEKVRRVRLLLALSTAALLALVAAWPSQGAAAEAPPLYLARHLGSEGTGPRAKTYIAVADGPRLAAHTLADREDIADLEVIDSSGRVIVLHPGGQAEPTGEVIEPAELRAWLKNSFDTRWQTLDSSFRRDRTGPNCSSERQRARDQLNLPTHQGGRALTLAETFVEVEARLFAMHLPENQIPPECLYKGAGTGHRAGYLHNLWHRLTGSHRDPPTG